MEIAIKNPCERGFESPGSINHSGFWNVRKFLQLVLMNQVSVNFESTSIKKTILTRPLRQSLSWAESLQF